jgi:copper chaperone
MTTQGDPASLLNWIRGRPTDRLTAKMTKVTEFKVGMTCDGCSSACTRILSKIEGVSSVQCDVAKQQILVEGDADENAMLEALLKWSKASGKSVALA